MVYVDNIHLGKKQRQKNLERHFGLFDWPTIYKTWCERIADFDICLQPLFKEIDLYDPASPVGRDNEIEWWESHNIVLQHQNHQRRLDRHPGTHGYSELLMQRGVYDTMDHLWQHKDNPEMIAAILISASLFSRVGGRNNFFSFYYTNDHWPPHSLLSEMLKVAMSKWLGSESHYGSWHHSCTRVLPYLSDDMENRICDVRSLIRYFAEEHALMFNNFCLVVLKYTPKRNPFIENTLREKSAIEEKEYREIAARRAAREAETKAKLSAYKKHIPVGVSGIP